MTTKRRIRVKHCVRRKGNMCDVVFCGIFWQLFSFFSTLRIEHSQLYLFSGVRVYFCTFSCSENPKKFRNFHENCLAPTLRNSWKYAGACVSHARIALYLYNCCISLLYFFFIIIRKWAIQYRPTCWPTTLLENCLGIYWAGWKLYIIEISISAWQ